MGNTLIKGYNINFEDMQYAINEQNKHNQQTYQNTKILIINTLDMNNQQCLIAGTIPVVSEVETINYYLKTYKDVKVIIYGMNSSDDTCINKYDQLIKLGFYNVYIYSGGLFEWLLLQDIYGSDLFPTTNDKVDFLKYKGRKKLNINLLEN
jgi:rhodanese-related sulfurtransferase